MLVGGSGRTDFLEAMTNANIAAIRDYTEFHNDQAKLCLIHDILFRQIILLERDQDYTDASKNGDTGLP